LHGADDRRNGKIHSQTVEASSVFDAANQAVQRWWRLWWFDPGALIRVESGEQRGPFPRASQENGATVSLFLNGSAHGQKALLQLLVRFGE